MDQPSDGSGFAYCRSEFSNPEGAMAELFDEDLISDYCHFTEYGNTEVHGDYSINALRPQLPMNHSFGMDGIDVQTQETFPTTRDLPMICTQQPTCVLYAHNGVGFVKDMDYTKSPTSVDQQSHSSYANNEFGFNQQQSLPISPIDPVNNIYLTPPQGQISPFDPGCLHMRTPSLDSGTTIGSTNGLSNNNVQSPHEQGFPFMEGLSSNYLGNLSSTLSPKRGRSASGGSKRSTMDIGEIEIEVPLKRARSVQGGYPCTDPACDKSYNRACDVRKHFKTVHGDKPYPCDICVGRFSYPKDVRRHMLQVHGIFVPVPPNEKKSHSHLTSMSSVVKLLSKLKLWHKEQTEEEVPKEDPRKYILVTRDHENFRKICLDGVESSEALMREIGKVFGIGHVDDALLRCCGGEERLGKRVVGKQLMAAVGKAVKAGKTLELHLTHKSDVKWRVPNCGD